MNNKPDYFGWWIRFSEDSLFFMNVERSRGANIEGSGVDNNGGFNFVGVVSPDTIQFKKTYFQKGNEDYIDYIGNKINKGAYEGTYKVVLPRGLPIEPRPPEIFFIEEFPNSPALQRVYERFKDKYLR